MYKLPLKFNNSKFSRIVTSYPFIILKRQFYFSPVITLLVVTD